MLMKLFFSCILVVQTSHFSVAQDAQQPTKLTQEDKKMFEDLFGVGLFDPKGAELVYLGPKARERGHPTYYWKKGGSYFSVDGLGVKVTLKPGQEPEPAKLEQLIQYQSQSNTFMSMGYPPSPPDLALAAWAYRLGKEELAAEILATTRTKFSKISGSVVRQYMQPKPPKNIREGCRQDLCWWAFVRMKNALEGFDDDKVIQLYDCIQSHFKTDVVTRFPQGEEVLADIARRKQEGALGKPRIVAVPEEYKKWTQQEKISFLIKGLQEYSSSFSGDDFRLYELVKLGEDALPALFDCIEKDTRLARSGQEGGIRHIPNKDRFTVKQLAYDAVSRILKSIPQASIQYDPKRTQSEYYRLLGAHARKYWEVNKNKPQLARFYETLCDLTVDHYSRSKALSSLLVNDKVRDIRLHDANQSSIYWPEAPSALREDLAKFQNPTIAEAIFRSLDHDLQQKAKTNQPYDVNMYTRYHHSYENCFLVALVYLGDRRAIPELQKREAQAESLRLRMKLAMALHQLGESKPLAKLAREIADGKEPKTPFAPVTQLTIGETWDIHNLEEVNFVQTLIAARLLETEQALMSFTQPGHPLYPYFASRFTYEHRHRNHEFTGHPYCLYFLTKLLKDTGLTGSTFRVENGQVVERSRGSASSGTPYGELKDPTKRRDEAQGCHCDEMMMRMREVVFGLVEFHPLFKDSKQRFDRNYKWITTHTFRTMTPYERGRYNTSSGVLVPDLQPLAHPATKADVDALRAAFAFDGDARCIAMKLPAWMVMKEHVSGNYVNRRGLIVQAEDRQGKKQYGVLYENGLKAVREEEVLQIEAYEPDKRK